MMVAITCYGQRNGVEKLKGSLEDVQKEAYLFADDALQLKTYTGALDLLTRGDMIGNFIQKGTYQKLYQQHKPAVAAFAFMAVCTKGRPSRLALLGAVTAAGLGARKWYNKA